MHEKKNQPTTFTWLTSWFSLDSGATATDDIQIYENMILKWIWQFSSTAIQSAGGHFAPRR